MELSCCRKHHGHSMDCDFRSVTVITRYFSYFNFGAFVHSFMFIWSSDTRLLGIDFVNPMFIHVYNIFVSTLRCQKKNRDALLLPPKFPVRATIAGSNPVFARDLKIN
jgi:hypothetical protein